MPPAVTCVFCGAPIEAREQMSGRPPHAAHARCADAALADDRHWDAIAAASGEETGDTVDETRDAQPAPAGPGAGRAGCLGVVVLGAIGAAACGVALGSDLLHRLDGPWVERQRR